MVASTKCGISLISCMGSMGGKRKNPIFAYSAGMSGTAHKVENASLKEVVNVYLADAARAEQGGGP